MGGRREENYETLESLMCGRKCIVCAIKQQQELEKNARDSFSRVQSSSKDELFPRKNDAFQGRILNFSLVLKLMNIKERMEMGY